ncbi:unnamed protein product [Arctogadus glacialis]
MMKHLIIHGINLRLDNCTVFNTPSAGSSSASNDDITGAEDPGVPGRGHRYGNINLMMARRRRKKKHHWKGMKMMAWIRFRHKRGRPP